MHKESQRGGVNRIILILALVAVCAYIFFGTDVFNIKHIEVVGNSKVSAAAVTRLSGIQLGEGIFAVNCRQAEQLVQTQPMVKAAEISRHFPSTITIKITERQPWAMVPAAGGALVIDDEGVYIEQLNYISESGLPLITLEQIEEPLTLGQFINRPAIEMIKTYWNKMLPGVRAQISEFHFVDADASIIVYTLKGTEVRLGNLDRVDEKVQFMTRILQMEEEFGLKGTADLFYVDMRFQGTPVLKNR